MKPFVVFLFSAIRVVAQAHSAAGIAGTVSDPPGAAVPQASVRLFTPDATFRQTTTTDEQARFRFERLAPAEYLIEARTEGLDQASPEIVKVEPGRTSEVQLRLDVRGLATQVQVTAAGTPQSTIEAGKALDIIDSPQLERRAGILVGEAARLVPGLRVQQLGGPGSFTRIPMRGLRAADNGVLTDGMRLRDPASVQGDATAFPGDLQLINTDRIEILRGLGSSVYGANATAGVLHPVTDAVGGAPAARSAAKAAASAWRADWRGSPGEARTAGSATAPAPRTRMSTAASTASKACATRVRRASFSGALRPWPPSRAACGPR